MRSPTRLSNTADAKDPGELAGFFPRLGQVVLLAPLCATSYKDTCLLSLLKQPPAYIGDVHACFWDVRSGRLITTLKDIWTS